MNVSFIIYGDLESLLEKMSTCHNNTEKSSTTKINKHKPSGYSLFTQCSFDKTKNRLDCYKGKDCMKNFCLDLKKHARKIIYHKKKEMTPLTKQEEYKLEKKKFCYMYRKPFSANNNNMQYHKVKVHCHYTGKYSGAAHVICNLKYNISREVPLVFHNGSTYDYHFIIKELAKKIKGEFNFSVLIK